MKILGNEIKPGMLIEHKDDLWEVLKTQHVKPGKGGAFNQVEIKSINKNTKLNERFSSSDSVLKENLEVIISFHNEKPISLELPNQINCKINSTDVALKGQTVSSSYKPAILDNGIKIQVPPFVESGDEIIVDTRSIEYVKKV